MDDFWNAAVGSEILGYFNQRNIFKLIFHSPTEKIYKFVLSTDVFFYSEKEAKNLIQRIIKEYPVRFKFKLYKHVAILPDGTMLKESPRYFGRSKEDPISHRKSWSPRFLKRKLSQSI